MAQPKSRERLEESQVCVPGVRVASVQHTTVCGHTQTCKRSVMGAILGRDKYKTKCDDWNDFLRHFSMRYDEEPVPRDPKDFPHFPVDPIPNGGFLSYVLQKSIWIGLRSWRALTRLLAHTQSPKTPRTHRRPGRAGPSEPFRPILPPDYGCRSHCARRSWRSRWVL